MTAIKHQSDLKSRSIGTNTRVTLRQGVPEILQHKKGTPYTTATALGEGVPPVSRLEEKAREVQEKRMFSRHREEGPLENLCNRKKYERHATAFPVP